MSTSRHLLHCKEYFTFVISSSSSDNVQMADLLSFWSGAPVLTLSDGDLKAKFDGGAHDFPLSKTCFRTILPPTKHAPYEKFKVNMDIALKFGSKGFSIT